VAVAYDAGGGLPHGRIGLGDGYVDREAYSRRRSSSASSSRSQSTAETNELKEQLRRTQEQMQQMQYLMMAQFLAGGSTGSQFGMPQQSQGSESGQAYSTTSGIHGDVGCISVWRPSFYRCSPTNAAVWSVVADSASTISSTSSGFPSRNA